MRGRRWRGCAAGLLSRGRWPPPPPRCPAAPRWVSSGGASVSPFSKACKSIHVHTQRAIGTQARQCTAVLRAEGEAAAAPPCVPCAGLATSREMQLRSKWRWCYGVMVLWLMAIGDCTHLRAKSHKSRYHESDGNKCIFLVK